MIDAHRAQDDGKQKGHLSMAAPRVSAERLKDQLTAIFKGWGMVGEQVEITAQNLLWADLRGIDSHGAALLPLYNDFRRGGKLTLNPEIKLVRETPATALLDGGGGLGHYPSVQAMNKAIEKCARAGIGSVAVRNSNHFGAAGAYAMMAAERGLIGLATTSVWRPTVVPTFGAEPMFGTNPIAFAAPGGRRPAFCLDMATSTVALGKLKLAVMHQEPIPPGWALDEKGRPLLDPIEALKHGHLTPLGGAPEMSSHKGYGLAAMVEILSTLLPGAFFATTRARRHPEAERYNIGHFFVAVDPKAFREEEEFESEMDDFIDTLHATRPANPEQPVLVPGEPEQKAFAERSREGIPIPPVLARQLRTIAEQCGAAWLLE
jgi:LDH2 family malate/lactate/ureidoglycolate dehydrogenase